MRDDRGPRRREGHDAMALPAARADRKAPAAAAAITALTRDTILVPTVMILVGSFLDPVSMVAFALAITLTQGFDGAGGTSRGRTRRPGSDRRAGARSSSR